MELTIVPLAEWVNYFKHMKISNTLIERIAIGLTLFSGASCNHNVAKTNDKISNDSTKTSVEILNDTLKNCNVPQDSLTQDSLIEENTPIFNEDYCPPCGMG